MSKRSRSTGVPYAQAEPETQLRRLRIYRGPKCSGCPLNSDCDSDAAQAGPWQVVESDFSRAIECLENPNVTMVPIRAIRIKEAKAEVVLPPSKKSSWVALFDANVFIEGAKGKYKGLKEVMMDPPAGFEWRIPTCIRDEIKFLPGGADANSWFSNVKIEEDPAEVMPKILETQGRFFTSPSRQDAVLFQYALEHPDVDFIVSSDKFHGGSGLLQSLGIGSRVRVMLPRDFVGYVQERRQ